MSRLVKIRSKTYALACTECALRHEPTVHNIQCRDCGGTLAVEHLASFDATRDAIGEIGLGQGNTPSVELTRTANHLSIASLTAKLEFMSPTGSFKDRGSATVIEAAREERVTEFVEDSSGNAGASMAAYAAAAGIKAHIFAPSSAAPGKLEQIRLYGAELHAVDGPRQSATDAAIEFAAQRNIPYLSHALSPWFIQGMTSFANEFLLHGEVITDIVLPVGNGSLLLSTVDLLQHVATDGDASMRVHAVQSDVVHPLVTMFHGESESPNSAKDASTKGISPARTVASGISVTSPPRLAEMCAALRQSVGTVSLVDDGAILDWQQRLAKDEGIFCEATSSAAFAGLEKLVATGQIGADACVLVPITGSGLKEPVHPR